MNFTHEGYETTSLPWLASSASPDKLLPGGGRMADGVAAHPSGTMVVQNANGTWRLFTDADLATVRTGELQAALILHPFDPAKRNKDLELLLGRAGSVVRINYLPGYATMTDAEKNAVKALYTAQLGNEWGKE